MSPYRRFKRWDPRRYYVHARLLGRRGGALLNGGIMWLLEGALVIRHHEAVPGYWLLSHEWKLQAAAWIICGLIACGYAFRKQGRDAPGWYLGLYPMAAWVVLVIFGAAIQSVGAYDWSGLVDVLLSGGINFGILIWIFIMTGWREKWNLRLPVTANDIKKDDAP